ncbi:MAG: Hsp33 family molecular chaperone [Pseudomonadota bacterium]
MTQNPSSRGGRAVPAMHGRDQPAIMPGTSQLPDHFHAQDDDYVIPFAVEPLDVRGRVIRLGPLLDTMLDRHDYPEPVSRLLAEMVVFTLLLGTALKFDGRFIVQAQGDGPVSLLVVDFTTPDGVRAMARYDSERLDAMIEQGIRTSAQLMGKGHLALTVDQGPHMQRYQGVVAMQGESLEEMAQAYFLQSEQIPTRVRLSVAQSIEAGDHGRARWRAGGLLAQYLPRDASELPARDLHPGDHPEGAEAVHEPVAQPDRWREAEAMVATIESDELVDPQLGSDRLLFRLFHERGVRVFEGSEVVGRCSCSPDRVQATVKTFGDEPDASMLVDGAIEVTCEFCSRRYRFDPDSYEQVS